MKRTLKIILPIVLTLAILLCSAWYLLVYDRDFTRDMFLGIARYAESNGKQTIAAWFYDQAYLQAGDNDDVAIELAEQYKKNGNYTQAQYTLAHAIADGGGIDLYIALCKTYVEQDKLLDAVKMLDNVSNAEIKAQLDDLRPKAPTATPEPGGIINQYISVTLQAESGTIYVTTDRDYPSIQDDLYRQPIPLTDGENTIRAVAIGENGLISKLTHLSYTIGGVVKKVEFADAAMEAAVRETLDFDAEKEIFTNDLWDIKTFTVPGEVKDYRDLSHFIFLEELTIENGSGEGLSCLSSFTNLKKLKITDVPISQSELTAICALPSLTELTLNNCGLSDISAISKATDLIYLDLSDNQIAHIEPLANQQKLQTLLLCNASLKDLTPLSALSSLTKLDVSYNSLSTLAPILGLSRLTWLEAGNNYLVQTGDMSNLKALTHLGLNSNKLTDISGISACISLTNVALSGNELTDVSALASLNALLYADFSHNQVKELPTWNTNCSLISIDGSHNQISTLENLSGLSKLNIINMDYNEKISSVKDLASCPMLVQVNVYGTKVKDVSALTNLQIIVNYNPT